SPFPQRAKTRLAVGGSLPRPADHSSDHSHGNGRSNKGGAESPKVLSGVAELIAIVRTKKLRRTRSVHTVAAFVNELRLGNEEYLPTFCFEAPAKIHILVPRRKKLLVEVTDVVIGVAPYHQRGRRGLIYLLRRFVTTGCWAVIDRPYSRNSKIL